MITVKEAVSCLQKETSVITEMEKVSLFESVGRILAEDAAALFDQPPFPRSPLDGYAIRAKDSVNASKKNPVTLKVIGEVCAGAVFSAAVKQGEAVRIMTGAPIPKGADTVIKQEDTDYGMEKVQIYDWLSPYQNYCYQGEDYKAGDVLLKKGTVLDGVAVGILASLGFSEVLVYRKPRVGIISTGDEVMEPGADLKPGKIYDSNLYLIGARLKELGITPVFLLHCEDNPEKMTELIRKKEGEVDLLITTGGVSVGKKDIMHEVLNLLSANQLFWKVALKPGSPTLAALYEKTLLICLSGNPFGAAANFELLVRPVLAALTGSRKWEMKRERAIFQCDFPKASKNRRYIRGFYNEGKVWIPERKHSSGILSTMAGCNCLIEIEPGNAGLKKGYTVWVNLL
ncbi:MAG: molybdopterin molybdotransferase MoeA [Lachnospiraceae bacterium]|nr:molybdopterin molybdotransferase MoeA [Lachnospiraceae bacterium]